MNAAKTKPLSARQRAKQRERERDLESFRDIADDVIESDFVPYACLYDENTIATKNGELVQIIRITGLGFDAQSQGDLRTAIRTAIRQCIPDASYAIWLHTLRRRKSLIEAGAFPDAFSAEIDQLWQSQHPASASFVNELYISVIKAAQQANLNNLQAMSQSLWPPRDRLQRSAYLDRALTEINATTTNVLKTLKAYGARLLTTVERNGAYYGEHLEFLEKLINLEERPMGIPTRDLSFALTSGEITFGHNAMEVRTAEGHRRFASILTVKEYKEATLAGIDKFLDIPCELIVTQCFDFVGAEHARQTYETQARYLTLSGDTELAKWVEIDRLMNDTLATTKAFGQQQTSLFLIATSVKQLEANVRMTQKALAKLGMVVIREDLRFEDCYWAQLPSNFPFIARQHSVDTQHLAGFANLQRAPMGNASGSPWGPPVSLLSTVQDTPYFFNFQRPVGPVISAHTLLLGKPGSGRTTLAHFLLAQARKLKMNIWYLDVHGRAEALMKAMGGTTLVPGTANLRLNPFTLEPTKPNREFLSLWLATLLDPHARQLTPSSLTFFRQLVDQLLTMPPSQRRLSALVPLVREQDALLANSLTRWTAGGEFGELFDMPADQFTAPPLIAWDLSRWASDEATLLPLSAYLLHRLTGMVNGQPTLIVLDEAFALLKTPLFGPRATAWLDFLSQQNVGTMLMTSDIEGAAAMPFAPALTAKTASVFALPDEEPGAAYMTGFGFKDSDLSTLAYMNQGAHHVLLKRGEESMLLKLNLHGLTPALRATLSGRKPSPAKSPTEILSELMGYAPAAGVAS